MKRRIRRENKNFDDMGTLKNGGVQAAHSLKPPWSTTGCLTYVNAFEFGDIQNREYILTACTVVE